MATVCEWFGLKIFPPALGAAMRAGRILDFLTALVLLCEPVRSLTASLLRCCRASVFVRSVIAPVRALLFILGSFCRLHEGPLSPVLLRPDLNWESLLDVLFPTLVILTVITKYSTKSL
jgi:hypothetical protein